MKNRLTATVILVILLVEVIMAWPTAPYKELDRELREYVAEKDARIGIAVIVDGKDTVAVNGDQQFPMLSVFKFPQALAVADYCGRNIYTFRDTIVISRDEILENTWSPMRERYGVNDLNLPIDTLLSYMLRESDNNACDILFRFIGGPAAVQQYLDAIGESGITVRYTEDDMHRDIMTCYQNCASPLAMARLLDKFETDYRYRCDAMKFISDMMESCETGTDRLCAPLMDSGVVLGHKTGTGDVNGAGKIIGVNDVGYVNLPERHRYVIAVFISDSSYSLAETSSMIADISAIVLRHVNDNLHHQSSYRKDRVCQQ